MSDRRTDPENGARPLAPDEGPASEAGHIPEEPLEESTADIDPSEVESLGDLDDPGGR